MSSAVSDTQFMDVQKIVVTLDQPDLTIDPGNATRLVVTMINQQQQPDRLLLEVEGIDIEWYNIPVSAVNVAPGATVSERINFKVARSSENRAGSYPFLVRVVAMETGETGIAQAMLIVKPYDSLQLEMNPKRATSTFFRMLNDFEISVANEGNLERNLELFASDPDDDCVYEFDADHVALKPGQAHTILMAARPKSPAWIGSPHLYSFQVSARSSEDRYVHAKTQGQIERRAFVSPLAGLFLLLLAFSGIGYFAFKPVPPVPVKLINFAASAETVKDGEPVTLTWDISGDKPMIKLAHRTGAKGTDISDGELEKRAGNAQYVPTGPQTIYTIEVTGLGNDGKVEKRSVTVNVNAKPPAPRPLLSELTADSTKVHIGEPIILAWKARNADSFIIDPGGYNLSGLSLTQVVNTDRIGDNIEYTVRAISADKRVFSAKSIKIAVVPKDQPIAAIVDFGPPRGTIYFGDTVRLRWDTRRATGVRIDNQNGDIINPSLPPSGNITVKVNETVTYILTAIDNLGNKTPPKSVTITPQARPLPPVEIIPTPGANSNKPDSATVPPPMPVPPNDGASLGGAAGKGQ